MRKLVTFGIVILFIAGEDKDSGLKSNPIDSKITIETEEVLEQQLADKGANFNKPVPGHDFYYEIDSSGNTVVRGKLHNVCAALKGAIIQPRV